MYKKLLSVLLSLMMIVSSSLCVLAEDEVVDTTTLEAENVENETGGASNNGDIEESSDTTLEDDSEDEDNLQEVDEQSTKEDTNDNIDNNNDVDFEFVGGYIASEQDYNTPIYEPEFELYSNEDLTSYIPDVTTLPSIRNQNPYGTCWAHTAIGLTEFDLIKDGYKDNTINLSELQLAYFTYNFVIDPLGGTTGDTSSYTNDGTNNYLNKGGNLFYAARRLMQWISPTDETTVPYTNAASTLTSGLDSSYAYNKTNYHLANVYLINIKNNTDDLKRQILEHGGAGVAYYHNSSNYSSANGADGRYAFYDTGVTGTNHAVMIVGWDDNYSVNNFTGENKPTNNGAWLIRNSWGTDNYDYFWMSYETSSLTDTAYIYDIVENDGLDNNYQLDGGITAGYMSSTHVANVFSVEAKDNVDYELLKDVSISLTHSANVNCTIEIYTDLTNEADPLSGTKQDNATTEYDTTFAGVYTIELKEPVKLKPNSKFAVVVTISSNMNNQVYMDVEYPGDTNDANWTSSVSGDNNSFYFREYSYGNQTYQTSNKLTDRNYCIKAYTSNVKEYTVTYNLDGGTNADGNPEKISTLDGEVTLQNPTKTGYTFLGWYDSDNNKVEKISGDKNYTLTANWQVNTYTITYNNMDGATNATSNPTTVTYESGEVTLADPTKTNYEFKGWYSDSELKNKVTEIPAHLISNYTVYAKWEKVVYQYTITYNLNDGTNNTNNPAGITSESGEIKLENPTRDGYRFDGWYTDADFAEGTKIEAIPANPTSNYTLYAKWTKIYKVTYKYSGDSKYGTPTTVTGTLPQDAEYASGETVAIPALLSSDDKNYLGDGTRGTWSFAWDKTESFVITSDTKITGTWTFTPTTSQGKVGYFLVEKDSTKAYFGSSPNGLLNSDGENKYFYLNKFVKDDTFTVISEKPIRKGYVFVGWFDKERKVNNEVASAATIRKAGDKVTYVYKDNSPYCLDAIWAKLDVTGSTSTYDGKEHTISDELVIDNSNATWQENYAATALKEITVEKTEYSTSSVNDGAYSETKPSFKNAGTYTVKVRKTVKVGDTVTTLEGEANVVINKAPLTIATPSDSKVYDGNPLTAEGTISALVNGETVEFKTTGRQTNVGYSNNTYSIDWKDVNKDNYEIKETLGTLTVTAATGLTIEVEDGSKVYDGTELKKEATAYISNDSGASVVSDEDPITIKYSIDNGLTYRLDVPSITDVGELNVKVKATKANYQDAETTYKLTVTQRPVSFTGESDEKTYTGNEFNLTGVTVSSGTNEGLISGATHNVQASARGTNVGEYPGTITAADKVVIKNTDNVDITKNFNITTTPGKLTINKATNLDLQVENGEKTYDGTPLSKVATSNTANTKIEYSYDGTNYFETVPSVTYVDDYTGDNKTIYVRATNPNYETVSKTYTLKINQRKVDFYGKKGTYTYTGKQITIEGYDSSGLAPNDYATNITASVSGTEVNTYLGSITSKHDVVIKNGNKDVTNNYIIETTPGSLIITARPVIDISATGASKVYDGKELSVTATSNVSGATIEYSVDGGQYSSAVPSITNAGSITVKARASKEGYESSTVEYTLTVTRRPVTFTGQSDVKDYTAQEINLTGVSITKGSLVEGSKYVLSASAKGTNKGTYDGTITDKDNVKITYNGVDVADNYEITTEAGKLTINPLKVKVTIKGANSSVTYDGDEHSVDSYRVDVDNTLYSVDYIDCDGTFSISATNAGNYNLVIDKDKFSNTNDNFNVEFVISNGLLEIKKAPLTITMPSASKVYDGKPLTAEGSIKGLVNGETVKFKTTGTQTNVGSSNNTFTLNWGDTNPDNYNLIVYNGKLTVNEVKAPEESSSDTKVVTCEEAMNSKDWTWSESKKACVYKVSDTSSN